MKGMDGPCTLDLGCSHFLQGNGEGIHTYIVQLSCRRGAQIQNLSYHTSKHQYLHYFACMCFSYSHYVLNAVVTHCVEQNWQVATRVTAPRVSEALVAEFLLQSPSLAPGLSCTCSSHDVVQLLFKGVH